MLRKFRSMVRDGADTNARDEPIFVNEWAIPRLVNTIVDWQIINGVMLKYRNGNSIKTGPVNISLIPTPFPESLFRRAENLQSAFNELYANVSSDEAWLLHALSQAAEEDEFIGSLIEIHDKIKQEGFIQDLSLGIFRSDYMLHRDSSISTELDRQENSDLTLKQVEFNTVAVAGGCHATNAAKMHAHLANTDAFQVYDPSIQPNSLPPNPTTASLISALGSAHHAYGPPKSSEAKKTAILMVVQPYNFNVADERPLEYGVGELQIPIHRCTFREDVLEHTTLTSTRELLYHPPFREGLPPLEISVVYYRAGLNAQEYDEHGMATRLHLERSRAIKCPDILGQLAGAKLIQQKLAVPSVLNKFVHEDQMREALSRSFGKMYPLDDSDLGKQGQNLALDPKTAKNYVLKPCREGGGHNTYGDDIPTYLRSIPPAAWSAHILMELYRPPKQEGKIMTSASGIYEGDVVSELGIFGTCLWRRGGIGEKDGPITTATTTNITILENSGAAGWSFKTKPANVNEMSVVKGYGCFDCPRLCR